MNNNKMEILNNIIWFICANPTNAENKDTGKKLTKQEIDFIVFDSSFGQKVKLSFPLNNNFLFSETRELNTPITVKHILKTIYQFYKEPLQECDFKNAFLEMEDWMEDVIESKYDGDSSQLIKYDVFTDICTPDFCGIQLNKKTNEYFVSIGPE